MIQIDLADRTPPYVQIRSAILEAVGTGELRDQDRLPTVRQLAGDLGVAPGTVQRAYSELEEDGVVESKGRRGTFVRRADPHVPGPSSLESAAQRFVAEAERLGVNAGESIAAVAAALATRPGG